MSDNENSEIVYELVRVDNIPQEYMYLALNPHLCEDGSTGHWIGTKQSLYLEPSPRDRLDVTCSKCGKLGVFWFDISSFFPPALEEIDPELLEEL